MYDKVIRLIDEFLTILSRRNDRLLDLQRQLRKTRSLKKLKALVSNSYDLAENPRISSFRLLMNRLTAERLRLRASAKNSKRVREFIGRLDKRTKSLYFSKLRSLSASLVRARIGALQADIQKAKLIKAESLLGEISELKAQLNLSTNVYPGNFIGGLIPLKIDQELEFWPFEGEYWQDELGWFVFNIESQCEGNGGG